MKILNKLITTFLILTYCLFSSWVYAADTAGILPLAKTTFLDANGKPLTSGTVTFYIPGTTTLKTTWQDSGETTVNTNPVTLDSAGRAIIWGSGSYRQVVKDRNNNLIWDQVTSSVGTGGSSSTVGDGDLVGTMKPWAGLVAPNQYLFTYGQEVLRVSYPDLLTALTSVQAAFCTSGNSTLSGLADTTQLPIGSSLEASCVPSGTTIVSKTSNSIVVSNNANTSTNVNVTFFPWGNGNGTTTFNLPDLRGRIIAGRDNMGGTAANRLTTTYFGSSDPNSTGASGGFENITLAQNNLPDLTLTTSIAAGQGSHTHTFLSVQATGATGAGTPVVNTAGIANSGPTTLPAMTGTTPTGGSGTAFPVIQPTTTSNYIIKVLPDTSSSVATGVASLGGMTGVIACGGGLTCTGNIINVAATSGNVGSGTAGQLTFYASTGNSVIGNPNANISSGALTLGVAGATIGQLLLAGNTSGTATISPQAAAGSSTLTIGTSSGTIVGTASAPLSINSTTGNISITGAAGQILSGASPAFTATPTLGIAGSTLGTLTLAGNTSGSVLITPQATAGTPTLTLPNATGTFAVSATAPVSVSATTGNITCSTCATTSGGGSLSATAPIVLTGNVISVTAAALTKTDDTNVTLTLGGTPTTALLAATSLTLGWTGQLGLTRGGTAASLTASNGGIVYSNASALAILAGTATANLPLLSGASTTPSWATVSHPTSAVSGGIPYFSSTTVMGTSALLTANAIVLGGGAGTAPATLGSLGTTTTVLHGNAAGAPTFGAVSLTADVSGNLPNANLASQTANTVLGALTATTPSGLAVPSCSTAASALTWTSGSGFGCNTISGSGTVNSGTAGQMAYYATSTTTVSGNSNANISSGALSLGTASTTAGSVKLFGATSGDATIKVAAVAGTSTNFQLPSTNGTLNQVLQTDGSGNTSWVSVSGTGTVTSVTCSGGLTGGTFTTSGTCAADIASAGNFESGTASKLLDAATVFTSETTTTFGATTTLDFNTFINTRVTLTGNITTLTCSNMKASQSGTITFVQDGTGSRTMVAGWCSIFRWANGSRGVLSTAASSIDALFYNCISSSVCYVSLGKAQAN